MFSLARLIRVGLEAHTTGLASPVLALEEMVAGFCTERYLLFNGKMRERMSLIVSV